MVTKKKTTKIAAIARRASTELRGGSQNFLRKGGEEEEKEEEEKEEIGEPSCATNTFMVSIVMNATMQTPPMTVIAQREQSKWKSEQKGGPPVAAPLDDVINVHSGLTRHKFNCVSRD